MAEENQVTTKDPKKVEVGKRLAEHNCNKREELKVQKEEELKAQKESEVSQYYNIGAILAVGVIGSLGYYFYHAKSEADTSKVRVGIPQQPPLLVNKFEME